MKIFRQKKKLDFFKKPAEFLTSAASSKDQKNGYVFSHVDSVFTTSRSTSTYPCFGFEAALVRTEGGTNALRVLYIQPNSPAEEAGLKTRRLDYCCRQPESIHK